MIKRFKNIKEIPGPDGLIKPRISLEVNKKNEIKDSYWSRRFKEGAIEMIKDTPVEKQTPTKPKTKEEVSK